MTTIAPSDVVSATEIDLIFRALVKTTQAIKTLEIEREENLLIMRKVWNDDVLSKRLEPGKNDDLRMAQMRDRSPMEAAELDRIDEELKGHEMDLALLRIQKERIDYLLRMCGA